MPRALVLGSPIGHSLSPVLHRAAYASLGLTDWAYAAHDVDEAAFPAFVAGLGPQVRGLSLTMPLKEIAFTVADPVSDRARGAGAINTFVRTESGWSGDNTDIAGIVAALRGADLEVGPAPVGLVLGAGATARSALVALRELGSREITACARHADRAWDSLEELAESLDVQLTVRPLIEWFDVSADLAVSTLPGAGGLAAAESLARSGSRLAGVRLLDVAYADWPTPLASAAAVAGAQVVSGLHMLVHQAVEQVEQMTGHRPDWRTLLAAGEDELARRVRALGQD